VKLAGDAMSKDIDDDRVCVVCFRVADMPRPRVASDWQHCANCHEPIWVAKAWPAASAKICNHCMKRDGSKKPKREQKRGQHSRLH
jgi:hypothetical protein